jgi:hypothetical protein
MLAGAMFIIFSEFITTGTENSENLSKECLFYQNMVRYVIMVPEGISTVFIELNMGTGTGFN